MCLLGSPAFIGRPRRSRKQQDMKTPADSKQSIDEELGIQDVTNITEDWYARSESELASAVKSVLQPMEVDEPPEEQPPRMSNEEAPDVLGPDPGSGSPVHSHRRQGPQHTWRILQSSRGWKANHRIQGWFLWPTDYGTLHRGIDAKVTVKKTVNSEEDRGLGRRPWIRSVTDED